ncbi:1-(5-phosphoribosyl)-5-[(5-phosphoribosylamino)methylideneamino]imidazole-4-carboxamide isomerase [Flavobacterium rhizosphaerae]|uniref:1-(5-phosphoribosyl)-5-[(5-phosphoribosylamino)methylideneamino] imidazole-4-carboxamide isomerase n=1 Tax=Flavobacterium rhizosphaerae TaxID=3163298 RepID=A0ABW8YWW8_9FLAO
MKIIPAIDIINGKCVRLTQGDYTTQKVYNENPVEVARQFEGAGIQYLHLVDLDGAKSGTITNYKVLEAIAQQTRLKIDFGGGIKSDDDIQTAFNCGASQVTAGSIAVKNPELVWQWLQTYGNDKILLGADCHNRKIAINGWQQQSETDVFDFIQAYKQKGITTVICTDISKDGMLQGPSVALYKELIAATGIHLIASGGIASLKDVAILKQIGCAGAIIGKALYEGNITLKELSKLC